MAVVCDLTISYNTTIKPIISKNCNLSGCHDGSTTTSLADYITLRDGAVQIKSAVSTGRMPKNATLSVSDKNAIICWVDNGAKNN
jgi:hypothetical protein